MTSYELIPSNISDKFPIGPSAGAPDYKIINNDGSGIRSLNDFDKPFQSKLQNDSGMANVVGGGWKRKGGSSMIKKNKKTMNKKKMMNKKKKTMNKKKMMPSKKKHLLVKKRPSAYKRSHKNVKRRTLKIGGNVHKENTGVGYTMDTKNTDTLSGALATPYNVARYEY